MSRNLPSSSLRMACTSSPKSKTLDTKVVMEKFISLQIVCRSWRLCWIIIAIIEFRDKLFKSAPHRDHPVVKIFTFGSDDMNLMCYGRVGYKYPEGTTNQKEWAGRYKIVKTESGSLKFKYVQVIVVSNSNSERRVYNADILQFRILKSLRISRCSAFLHYFFGRSWSNNLSIAIEQ